jgi:hypothetical protein
VLNKFLFRVIALSVLANASVWAQNSGSATVQGTVKDATGAVVPGAKVTITHVETAVKTSTISNNEGFFVLPPVQIGNYQIRCEAQGMKAWEQNIVLDTGKTLEVNAVLTLGDVSQTVQVTAEVPLVTTTDPTNATTLDQQRIKELPINGRDLNTLLMDVTPGIEYGGNVNDGARTGGMMQYSTTYSQDGAPANNREFGGSQGLQGLESIAEVRVETNLGNAKSSTPASVTVTSRSGTNRYVASLYETARNNCCGVAKRLQDVNPNGAPFALPQLIRNEYGGSIGGPVTLPTFGLNGRKTYDGRNRTFFFVTREQLDLRQGLTYSFSVPTVAQRQGNFSGLETNTGLPITIYDPLTGQIVTQTKNPTQYTIRSPFPNNIIPVTRESPLAKYIYGITPLPTDITEPNIASNLKYAIGNSSLPSSNNNPTVIRVDHRFTDHDNFFAKANWNSQTSWFLGTTSLTDLYVPTTNKAANVTYLPMQGWAGALSETHVFSPTFFVETLLNRNWSTSKTMDGPPNQQQNWAALLGLPNPYGEIGWPNVQGVGTNFTNYIEGDNRRFISSTITTGQQNYSWIKNSHTIQFGWTYHDEVQRYLPDEGNISGSANFSSMATALQSSSSGSTSAPVAVGNTGFDAANFFLGDAATYSVYLSRGVMKVDQKNYALYLQDNWRVNERLTLTPGLRWDMNPAWSDPFHLFNTFDVKNHAVVLGEPLSYYINDGSTTAQVVSNFEKVNVTFETPQQAGLKSNNFFPSNMFDFGPRMGAAYRLFDGKASFVIRGGYGMYISPLAIRTLVAQFASELPFKATFQYNPNSASYSPDGTSNYLLTHPSSIIAGLNSTNVVNTANPNSLGIGQSVTALSPNMPSTKIQEWDFIVEKELGHSMVMRFTYDGKHGSDLDQLDNINPQMTTYDWYESTLSPLPSGSYSSVARGAYDTNAYTTVNFLSKTGMSNSQMFTAQLEKRFAHGLQFQGFYTLTNAYRLGGNSFRDSPGTTAAQFLPGSVPTDFNALNKFLNYQRDTGVPKHRVRWNFIYDLPFGHNRTFAPNAPKWLNAMIGGWSLTGSGTIMSTWFSLDSTDWGFTGAPVQVYGTKYPIDDCTATPATAKTPQDVRCYQGYYYWNGYISPKLINSKNAYGMPNGIEGLPTNVTPAVTPLVPYGAPGAISGNYDTNNVYITIKNSNGTTTNQLVAYNTGLNPFRNQYRLGPYNWDQDASIRKTFRLTESGHVNLRVALDVFNVFNNQGLNPPTTNGPTGTNGITDLNTSYGAYGFQPRQCQGSFRLEF